ncbi:MAG: hypothetical protein DDT25_00618 [Chloroflexi bacterium]|nr:hypothetical protein [Chloroflexota bacterium]
MKRSVTTARIVGALLALMMTLTLVMVPSHSRVTAAPGVGVVVDLVLLPASQTVNVGDIFDVTIEARCHEQRIIGVAAFLDFDPIYLEVLSITPGATLPFVLLNTFDNAAGTADYNAGKLTRPFPSGTFTVAVVTFRAKAPTDSTPISFHRGHPRVTDADFGGTSKLDEAIGATVTVAAPPDTIAPAAVTDLAVVGQTSNSVTLGWTAPGDDGNTGTASRYDLRYSTSEITAANFDWATKVPIVPAPKRAGGSESFTVTGLAPATPYWFALKTADEVPNWSDISNVVSATTVLAAPIEPPTVVTKAATNITANTATLEGDLTDLGTADSVMVSFQWGTVPGGLDRETSAMAMTVTGVFSTAIADLTPGTTYYFRAKAEGDGTAYGDEKSFTTAVLPAVAFSSATYTVGEAEGSATITVNLSSASTQEVRVNYATSDGTATAPGDYTVASGTLTFDPGVTSQSFTVTILNDDLVEGDETLNLTLSNPTNAVLGTPAVAVLTIIDDEMPEVMFDSATYMVAEDGIEAIITVVLSQATLNTVTVDYATSDGTATAPDDYTAASGTLTFAPGVTSQSFTVPITNDETAEGNETIILTLSEPSNAVLGTPDRAVLTIRDDESWLFPWSHVALIAPYPIRGRDFLTRPVDLVDVQYDGPPGGWFQVLWFDESDGTWYGFYSNFTKGNTLTHLKPGEFYYVVVSHPDTSLWTDGGW